MHDAPSTDISVLFDFFFVDLLRHNLHTVSYHTYKHDTDTLHNLGRQACAALHI